MADEKIIRIRVVGPGTEESEEVATGSVAIYQGHRFRTVVAFVAKDAETILAEDANGFVQARTPVSAITLM